MTDTTTDLTERLATIRGWAADAEPATDSAGAAALRCVGHLCDVVERLTDRVESLQVAAQRSIELIAALETEVERYANNVASTEREIDEAIRRHRDQQHEASR